MTAASGECSGPFDDRGVAGQHGARTAAGSSRHLWSLPLDADLRACPTLDFRRCPLFQPGPRRRPGDGAETHRSPVALALSADGGRLLTANQGAGTVSLVDPKAGKVLFEQATGAKPAGIAFSGDGRRAVVTHWYGSDLVILGVGAGRFEVVGRVVVGSEPSRVALSANGSTTYVAVGVANEVVRIDCAVNWQRAWGGVSRLFRLREDWRVERTIPIDGANLRQVLVGDQTDYMVNMRNRGFVITCNHIDQGWVLARGSHASGSTLLTTTSKPSRWNLRGKLPPMCTAWLSAPTAFGSPSVVLGRMRFPDYVGSRSAALVVEQLA